MPRQAAEADRGLKQSRFFAQQHVLGTTKCMVKNLVHIWVFPKIGGFPPKWILKIMENPMNKWMIWWYPYFWKHPFGIGHVDLSRVFHD